MATSTWTHERLDDRFDGIDGRLARLDARLDREFSAIRSGFRSELGNVHAESRTGFGNVRAEIREQGAELRGAIDDLRLTMLRVGGGIMVGRHQRPSHRRPLSRGSAGGQ